VTRDELKKLIWPEESFGDFDHAINLAITRLRGSLGDSADHDRPESLITIVRNPGTTAEVSKR
jgi:DNA-binding response OmpR family regulator